MPPVGQAMRLATAALSGWLDVHLHYYPVLGGKRSASSGQKKFKNLGLFFKIGKSWRWVSDSISSRRYIDILSCPASQLSTWAIDTESSRVMISQLDSPCEEKGFLRSQVKDARST
jgi:hypothetical protein